MKNLKCILGIHDYKTIGTQTVNNIVGGFSMTQLMRDVYKCNICNKVKIQRYDIATNAHLDETLDWKPKLNY